LLTDEFNNGVKVIKDEQIVNRKFRFERRRDDPVTMAVSPSGSCHLQIVNPYPYPSSPKTTPYSPIIPGSPPEKNLDYKRNISYHY
jgi:hypothetical protein